MKRIKGFWLCCVLSAGMMVSLSAPSFALQTTSLTATKSGAGTWAGAHAGLNATTAGTWTFSTASFSKASSVDIGMLKVENGSCILEWRVATTIKKPVVGQTYSFPGDAGLNCPAVHIFGGPRGATITFGIEYPD